jgi:uncharacterized protein
MGHSNSSQEFGGSHGICVAHRGAAEAAAPAVKAKQRRSLFAWALLFLLRLYVVLLSPMFGGACKFYPSCSNYAYQAVARYGATRGSMLAMKRLLRCRPFTNGGYDPVPESISEKGFRSLELVRDSAESRAVISATRQPKPGGRGITAKIIPATELKL